MPDNNPDAVKYARELLTRASRIHALNDSNPSEDEDVSWLLQALADEVEQLRQPVKPKKKGRPKGQPLSEEHKRRISESVQRTANKKMAQFYADRGGLN